MPSQMKQGDVVWVAVGDKHEEPALVLRTGCEYSEEEDDDDDYESDAAVVFPEEIPAKGRKTVRRADGVLVQLSVSMVKGIYPPSKVRPMDSEENNAEAGGKRVRRSAPARSGSAPQAGRNNRTTSANEAKATPKSTPPTSRSQKKRSTVTPSPTSAASSSSSSSSAAAAAVRAKAAGDGKTPGSRRGNEKLGTSAKVSAAKRAPPTDLSAASSPHFAERSSEVMAGKSSEDEETSSSPSSASESDSDAPPQQRRPPQPKAAARRKATAKGQRKSPVVAADSAADAKSGGKSQPAKKKPKITVVRDSSDSDSDVVEEVAARAAARGGDEDDDDDDDDDDAPFTVEYSPTGRATCRRCDQVIPRDCLRVSHTPLFRGKPGYKVYRHLDCTVFGEEIYCVQDVGGYRKLRESDLERLRERIVASRKEWEDENKEIQPDELVQLAFSGPVRPSPKGLCANLLPFQVEGASWMYAQEQSDVRGGILADEMGMGKTIQTIATILDNRPKLQHARPGAKHPPSASDLDDRIREEALWQDAADSWRHEMEMNNVSKKVWPKGAAAAARAGTLVVCPVIALSQWKSEIEKFTEGGSLTVGIYHGPDREKVMPRELMSKCDVVLTTYQVLEQDFRKMVSPNKVSCPNCGAKYKIDKLRVHLKYFCGEGAQRTEAQMRQRRTAPRNGRTNDGQNGGGSGKGGAKSKPPMKPPITKQKAGGQNLKPAPAKSKQSVKIHRTKGYDSDSDLSIEESSKATAKVSRPSRSAAVKATRRVSASFKEWGAESSKAKKRGPGSDDDEDESYSEADSSSCETDQSLSDGSISQERPPRKLSAPPAGRGSVGKRSRSDRSSEEDDSDDDEALARARATQQKALDAARLRKKSSHGSKKEKKGKAKGKGTAPARGKKKKFADSSSSDGSTDDDNDIDPLEGVDMDELMGEAMAGARFSVLHGFTWWRCVLDEAHFIKSRSSQTAASAFALTSVHRWCLSGTPLQNRVGELYSLIRFVRLDPMSHYFCRQCPCKSIHYRMRQGVCQDCGHRAFSHFSHFNKHVLNPIQRDGYTGDGRRAVFILKSDVMDKCLLRRTKENRAEDMNLPPRLVTIRPVRLHPVEEDFYNALYTQTKSSFDDYVAEGTVLNNYAHIFDLLTKMRQAVNHPYLIVYSSSDKVRSLHQPQQQAVAPVANGSVDCDMCHEPPVERVVSSCCGSGFCRSCVIEYLTGAVGDNTPCPSCARPFTIDLNQASADDGLNQSSADEEPDRVSTVCAESRHESSPGKTLVSTDGSHYAAPSLKQLPHVATGSILRRINLAEFATSTKIEVLVQELTEMRQNRPGNKALVFSQFVNMLDLIRWRLHSDPCLGGLGLGVRILHGGMDVKSRDAALKDFREDPNCRVLLMSLKAAGVALNLTVASECYLTDLWWNPAAEMQAIDRTHRLGQYRPIRAVRLVAEGTVEERVLQLQEKKRLVFDGTIGRDAGSLKMLTVDDMVQLFS